MRFCQGLGGLLRPVAERNLQDIESGTAGAKASRPRPDRAGNACWASWAELHRKRRVPSKAMDLIIGSDHAGFGLKEICRDFLGKRKEYAVKDAGVFSRESSDYPLIAHKVARGVASGRYRRGILICGSGIGMSIVANRYKGIRAALCCDLYSARLSRLHNDANILAMGERVLGTGLALEILGAFLDTEFEGGRHQLRIDQIDSAILSGTAGEVE